MYYLFFRRSDYLQFNTPAKFDTLYKLHNDPFNVSSSNYEQTKFNDLCSILDNRRFSHTLDLGCGPGYMTARFARFSDHITSVDFSAKALELARESCQGINNITFVQADVSKFTSTDKFDLFFCSEILYYLDQAQFNALIANIKQMAAPEAEMIAICRSDDQRVRKTLQDHFTLEDTRERTNFFRPYIIYRFAI